MKGIKELIKTIKRLRSPKGCPWDKKQTHKSLKRYLIEETYEAIDAIDNNDYSLLKEELGDVLLQIVLHAQIASEKNRFNFDDIASFINKKMISRHPHVFSNVKVKDINEVMINWEKIKNQEKTNNTSNIFHNIPYSLPSLLYALKVSKKAAKKGFEWEKEKDIWKALNSEIREFKAACKKKKKNEQVDELGDILFTIVNIARWKKIDPEESLRLSSKKFIKRFKKVNIYIDKNFKNEKLSSILLNKLWKRIKQKERGKK